MGPLKKLFALPKSPGLKAIAIIIYGFIVFFLLGFAVNLVKGGP